MKSVNIAVDGKYAEESAQEMIEDLREVLEKLGITVEITEGFHDTKYLSFRYDVDEIRKKAGRNAGAKYKAGKKAMSVAEAKERMEDQSAEQLFLPRCGRHEYPPQRHQERQR